MFHVLAPAVGNLGHGVELSSQNDINSKTLVCYLDSSLNFHYGFAFKNGSNLRVICWENNVKRIKTVPKANFVIAFKGYQTQKGPRDIFVRYDFDIPWFGAGATQDAKNELVGLHALRNELNDLINRLAGLNMQELNMINEKIDELHVQG